MEMDEGNYETIREWKSFFYEVMDSSWFVIISWKSLKLERDDSFCQNESKTKELMNIDVKFNS